MARYRPPAEKSSAYITSEGHAVLKAEFDHLWRQRRPEVVAALSAAAAEGDRSENAEYIYRKKELREIDRRLKYITTRLEKLTVVTTTPADTSKVYFGGWVRIVDSQGAERELRIVGPDEADAKTGKVSMDSPLARALLKRSVGDVVMVKLPTGEQEFELIGLRYGQTNSSA